MAIEDAIKELAAKVSEHGAALTTEEATKTAIVLPFIARCDTTYTKEFQIQAEVTLKSKKMGVVKSDNVKLACNFKVS